MFAVTLRCMRLPQVCPAKYLVAWIMTSSAAVTFWNVCDRPGVRGYDIDVLIQMGQGTTT